MEELEGLLGAAILGAEALVSLKVELVGAVRGVRCGLDTEHLVAADFCLGEEDGSLHDYVAVSRWPIRNGFYLSLIQLDPP